MSMSKLTQEEKEILEAFESGKLKKSKKQAQEIEKLRAAAEATFKKDARINIQLSSRDLRALQWHRETQNLVGKQPCGIDNLMPVAGRQTH